MKKTCIGLMIILSIPALLLSCEALPINYSRSQSWLMPGIAHNAQDSGEAHDKSWTTITLLGVQVDRKGGWDSVEREVANLAPLFFWNQGCRVVAGDEQPVYAADVQVREREFYRGWRTKRSLAVEVRIWDFRNAPAKTQDQKLPLAAGRVIAMGERTLSSSETTGRMLSMAIKKAAKRLSAYERKR